MDIDLNNKLMKHEFKIMSKEEILENRSNAYKFINFDKPIIWNKKPVKIYKLNFIQKILIKFKIIKDPRYNGKKNNVFLIDEMGQWDFKNK
jgi:hypothetical protein